MTADEAERANPGVVFDFAEIIKRRTSRQDKQ